MAGAGGESKQGAALTVLNAARGAEEIKGGRDAGRV